LSNWWDWRNLTEKAKTRFVRTKETTHCNNEMQKMIAKENEIVLLRKNLIFF